MNKRALIIIALCTMLVLSVIPVAFAKAKWTTEGISEEKQAEFIRKANSEELLDCLKPEMRKNLPKDFYKVSIDEPSKKYVYPDGSYTKLTVIEITPENKQELVKIIGNEEKVNRLIEKSQTKAIIQPMIVSKYYNIWVQEDSTLTGGGFAAEFLCVDDGSSRIYNISEEQVWCTLGTAENEILSIKRMYQDGGNPANARLSWDFITMNGAGQYPYQVNLYVEDMSYWSTIQG